MLNINEMRANTRRSDSDRRVADRRMNSHAFGSPEWFDNIKASYAYCPKFDRRKLDRRSNERRMEDRRQQQLSEYSGRNNKRHQLVLTPEERKLIEDLYLNDLD